MKSVLYMYHLKLQPLFQPCNLNYICIKLGPSRHQYEMRFYITLDENRWRLYDDNNTRAQKKEIELKWYYYFHYLNLCHYWYHQGFSMLPIMMECHRNYNHHMIINLIISRLISNSHIDVARYVANQWSSLPVSIYRKG